MSNAPATARFRLWHKATVLNEHQHKVLNYLPDTGPDGFRGGVNIRKYTGLPSYFTQRTRSLRRSKPPTSATCPTPAIQLSHRHRPLWLLSR
jgi:hypothetical protein